MPGSPEGGDFEFDSWSQTVQTLSYFQTPAPWSFGLLAFFFFFMVMKLLIWIRWASQGYWRWVPLALLNKHCPTQSTARQTDTSRHTSRCPLPWATETGVWFLSPHRKVGLLVLLSLCCMHSLPRAIVFPLGQDAGMLGFSFIHSKWLLGQYLCLEVCSAISEVIKSIPEFSPAR